MRIACAQFAPLRGDVNHNLRLVDELAAQCHADILVLPELALTGYFFKSEQEVATLAEPLDSLTALTLSAIARKYGLALVAGFMESSDYANAHGSKEVKFTSIPLSMK